MTDGEKTPDEAPGKSNLMPPWKPGQSGNPAGRPKGSRNKLAEDFCAALLADFAENGEDAIKVMRHERPNEYAKMIASILPKEFEGNLEAEVTVKGALEWKPPQ